MSGLRLYKEKLYPKVELAESEKHLKMFFKFMRNRQLIWKRRFKDLLPRSIYYPNYGSNDHWSGSWVFRKQLRI